MLFVTFNDAYLGDRTFIIGDKDKGLAVELVIVVDILIDNDSFIAKASSSP